MSKYSLDRLSRSAGYLGLVPFVASLILAIMANSNGAMVATATQMRSFAEQIGLIWGAIILTFVGAAHWGFAVAGAWRWQIVTLLGSILPSIVALSAALLGGIRGYAVLVAGLGFFWLYEHRYCVESLPADYLRLRRVLTLSVCALLVLIAVTLDAGSHR